jgi:hypothetical protein
MSKTITVLITWRAPRKILNMISFARFVVQQMTGNPNFPTPAVTLSILADAATAAETAYNNRKNGAVAKLANKSAAQLLSELLYEQANYVNNIAQGDAKVIAGAGYTPTKDGRTSAVTPGMPGAAKVVRLNTGGVKLSLDTVPGADSYTYVIFFGEPVEVEIEENHLVFPPTVQSFLIINDGTTREEIRSLAPGTKFSVMALAQNAAGKSGWGPLISAAA